MGAVLDGLEPLLVMEFMDNGSLRSILHNASVEVMGHGLGGCS